MAEYYRHRIILFAVIALFCLLLFPQKAYAYIDLSSGSFVFQVIIAALLGAIFTLKVYWKRTKDFLSNIFTKKNQKRNN